MDKICSKNVNKLQNKKKTNIPLQKNGVLLNQSQMAKFKLLIYNKKSWLCTVEIQIISAIKPTLRMTHESASSDGTLKDHPPRVA